MAGVIGEPLAVVPAGPRVEDPAVRDTPFSRQQRDGPSVRGASLYRHQDEASTHHRAVSMMPQWSGKAPLPRGAKR